MKYVILMIFSAAIVMSMNTYKKRVIVVLPSVGYEAGDSVKHPVDSIPKQSIFAKIARFLHKKKDLPIDSTKFSKQAEKLTGVPSKIKMNDSTATSKVIKKPKTTVKESLLNFFGFLRKEGVVNTKLDNNSLSHNIKSPIDSSKKKTSPINIHGTAIVSAYYSDYQYPGQSLPSNYVHTQINPSVEVFGIPFKLNAFIGTEQNVFKNLDAFSISFDWMRMRDIANGTLQQSLNEKQLFQNKALTDQLSQVQEFNQLGKLLNDKDYLSNIENQKKLLEQKPKLDSFGLAQNARQLETAENDVKNYESQLTRYQALEPNIQQYNENIIKQRMLVTEQNEQGTVSQRLNSASSPYGKYLGLLYAIKSFDIGMCHPVYSDLTMNGGLGIKGFNFAINPDNVFFGITEGKTIFNNTSIVGNAWQYNQTPRDIYAVRLGYGVANKAIITATLLQGIDLPGSPVLSDTSGLSNVRYRNTVASVNGLINYHDEFSFSAEGAKSISTALNSNEANPAIAIPSNIFSDNTAGSTAWSLKGTAKIPVLLTRLSAAIQQVGGTYNSYGLAYLQSGVQTYNFKADQDIFHRHVTVSAFLRKQSDNLLQTEQVQTTTRSYGGSATFKWANLPIVMVSYSPTAQYSVMHISGKDSNVFASNLLTASVTYTKQKKKLTSSTTLSYSSSKTNTLVNDYVNSTYTFNQLLNVNGIFSIIGTGSYVNAIGLLGYNALLCSGSIEKVLQKGQSVTGGLMYQDQTNAGFRKGVFLAYSFSVSKFASLNIRGDYFMVSDTTNDYIPQMHYSINTSLMVRW